MSEKLTTGNQAARAIFVDFEKGGNDDDPLALLGVWYNEQPGESQWQLRQFLLNDDLKPHDQAASTICVHSTLETTLDWLLNFSDDEKRHIISWSRHDRDLLKAATGERAFRYRNAIAVAKRWRKRQVTLGNVPDTKTANRLSQFEEWTSYSRPPELYEVGESLRYLRQLKRPTEKGIARWETIVSHNRHDVIALQHVLTHCLNNK